MLDARARQLFAGLARTTGTAISKAHIPANAVTAAGVGLTGVAAYAITREHFTAAGSVLAFAGAFDFLDGAVARASGKASPFGALIDSVTDRVSDGLVLGSLFWVLLRRGDQVAAGLALASLVVIQLVSYIKAKAESLGWECNVGLMERAERIFVICVGLILGILTIALWVLVLASGFTLLQRLVHVRKQARAGS